MENQSEMKMTFSYNGTDCTHLNWNYRMKGEMAYGFLGYLKQN